LKPFNAQMFEQAQNLASAVIDVMEMNFVEDYGSLSERVQALINGDADLVARILLIRPDIKEEKLSKCLTLTQRLLTTINLIPSIGKGQNYNEKSKRAELALFLARVLEVRQNQSKFFSREGLEKDYHDNQFPKFYELYENYLYKGSKDYLIFSIGNMVSSTTIDFNEWQIRQLSENEMSNLVEVHEKNRIPLTTYPELVISMDSCEEWQDKIKKIISLFRLIKREKVYLSNAYRAFGFPFCPWQILVVPEGTKTSKRNLYSASDVLQDETELRRFWNLISVMGESDYVITALRRFNFAYEREKIEDSWVDYFISLESLFATDSNSEVTHRASNRMARALGGEMLEEKKALRKKIKDWYCIRSRIVHGDKLTQNELVQISELNEKVRASIKWFIKQENRAKHNFLLESLDLS
jgi:hypothetical protein